MSADPRWLQLKKIAEKDSALNDATHRVLVGLIDRLAKTPSQLAGDPFILSWRVIQNITGGAVRGCCKKQAYRYVKALQASNYIFPTPKAYVRDFIVGKQSYNPAAVRYFNFKFASIKAEAKQEKNAEKAAVASKWAEETRRTLRSAD